MTPEAQRIAIAEACGAVCIDQDGPNKLWFRLLNGREVLRARLPDCPADLNACHEMEKVLMGDALLWQSYINFLVARCGTITLAITAPPPHRCEAFLRALNLWREE